MPKDSRFPDSAQEGVRRLWVSQWRVYLFIIIIIVVVVAVVVFGVGVKP